MQCNEPHQHLSDRVDAPTVPERVFPQLPGCLRADARRTDGRERTENMEERPGLHGGRDRICGAAIGTPGVIGDGPGGGASIIANGKGG